MSSSVEQIKSRLGIVDVVSSYVKLEKAGKNYRARCPFHNEKDPSFYVSPDRDSFYCFGCGAKGDIFSFVEQFEGLDFVGSLKVLADRAGVALEKVDPKAASERDRLFRALEDAAVFFEKTLAENKNALQYVLDRGITDDSRKHFRLGFAHNEWRALHTYLKQKGYADELLMKAGLIKKGEKGNYYDVFRSRIIFPIFDTAGRVIAFTGRIFGEDDVDIAKYLNSPETVLFQKSSVLYGFEKAKHALRKYDFCILVEGAVDCILAHQSGYTNTVAAAGTALTQNHLQKIKRLTQNLVLALDSDTAGIRAAGRHTQLALAMDFDVKVAQMSAGEDPADMIMRNVEEWKKAIKQAQHIIPFYLDVLEKETNDERDFKKHAREQVLPFIAAMSNRIDQAHFIGVLAQRLGVREEAITEEVHKIEKEDTLHTPSVQHTQPVPEETGLQQQLQAMIMWQETLETPSIDIAATRKKFLETIHKEELPLMSENVRERLFFQAEQLGAHVEDIGACVEEMLDRLKEEHVRDSFARLMMDLKRAEKEGDNTRAMEILKECKLLSEELQSIKKS